jgi:Ca-activated chloride channel family protein
MTNDNVQLKAGFDRELTWWRGRSVRYLVVELLPVTAPTVRRTRVKNNLAIIIDASGSMGGDRLWAAKRAAEGIVQGLEEADTFSVVSYASDIRTHVMNAEADRTGKKRAISAIREIETRGSTNLAGGWLKGAECVASSGPINGNEQRSTLLLTDGKANQGIVDPRQLGQHASALLERGIVSSAVGIGEDYSTDQIEAIANNGGGRLHHAADPGDIAEIVLGEIGEIREAVAENLVVEVSVPQDTDVSCLSDYPVVRQADKNSDGGRSQAANVHAVRVGGLASGMARDAVFKLQFSGGDVGTMVPVEVKALWREPGSELVCESPVVQLTERRARGRDNDAQARDARLSTRVAKVWTANVVRRAIELNRNEQFELAARELTLQKRYFQTYVADLPGADSLFAEFEKAASHLVRPMREMARKEVGTYYRNSARMQLEHRANIAADPWSGAEPTRRGGS